MIRYRLESPRKFPIHFSSYATGSGSFELRRFFPLWRVERMYRAPAAAPFRSHGSPDEIFTMVEAEMRSTGALPGLLQHPRIKLNNINIYKSNSTFGFRELFIFLKKWKIMDDCCLSQFAGRLARSFSLGILLFKMKVAHFWYERKNNKIKRFTLN